MKNPHNEQAIALDGSELRYTDAGSGNAVFLLQDGLKGAIADQLAEHSRVITFEVRNSNDRRDVTNVLGRTAGQLSINKCCIIAESELTVAAIAHAIESSDSVEALILIAPPTVGANGASTHLPLEQIKAPTLVLFGTRDEVVAPETGRTYARRIPSCFYTLVYDAGHDIAADRPQALCAVVRDFLEHRENFVVPHQSSAINP